MLDLSMNPVVDSHCHAFLPERETRSYEQYLTLADHPVPMVDVVNTFLYRQVVRELSRVMDFEGTHEEVVKERYRRYKLDPRGHIRSLFEDAGIETLLVDTGYPSKEFSGYAVDLEDFSKIVPCEVKEIVRIESVLYVLLLGQPPFDSLVEGFEEHITDAVGYGAVSLKSVIAYRTGLNVRKRSEEEARTAYGDFVERAKSGMTVMDIIRTKSEEVKTLFDFFFFLGLGKSIMLDVPFQVHAGIGDVPGIDLLKSNPLLLREVINDESARDAKMVLTHGGYPYIEEAGFLVNTCPNVYLDLSETIPFTSIGAREKLLNLFEMGPTNKLMHGSDGYNVPELFWFSAIQSKRALASALNDLLESKEIEEDWAEEIARQFLSENAKRIYKLE